MARPWVRWISRGAIAAVVVAALVFPVVFPETTTTIATAIATKVRSLPPASVTAMVVEIIVGALLVALAAIWWVWWRLPERQAARLRLWETKARADVEDNFRKTVGQALGGAAVLIGAGAAYLQFTQQQQASHDLLISNQVSKGFEQLASEKSVTMRLGGIYALEGVMNTSEQYRIPVLEALGAFVRDGTKDHSGSGDAPLAADIQAALTVIGRRKEGPGTVDLHDAKIPSANLRAANLSGVNLRGADLRRAKLRDANLNDADLTAADLSNADLGGADLIKAHLEGATVSANLNSADLSGADLSYARFGDANLNDANLRYTKLTSAYLREVRNLAPKQLEGACGWPVGPSGGWPPYFLAGFSLPDCPRAVPEVWQNQRRSP